MRLLTIFLAVALSTNAIFAGEPETPAPLIGRWMMQKSLCLGEDQSSQDIDVEIEFTATQMHLRMWRPSDERPLKPTYIGDYYDRSSKGLLMLDTKTAKDNPGPETDLEVLSIYKLDGNDLWICHGNSGDPKVTAPRPREFVSSPESKSDLSVFTRVSSK